jgi:hypothetical protein
MFDTPQNIAKSTLFAHFNIVAVKTTKAYPLLRGYFVMFSLFGSVDFWEIPKKWEKSRNFPGYFPLVFVVYSAGLPLSPKKFLFF